MAEASADQNERLSVRAVVALTGLTEHTLRAWERRYQAVVPERTKGGTRTYSDADVERLRLLHTGVAGGTPIRVLAPLDDEALAEQVEPLERPLPFAVEELIERVKRHDNIFLAERLGELMHLLGPRRFAYSIAGPLLQTVGDLWHQGVLNVAQEHLATSCTRATLEAGLAQFTPPDDAPVVIFATPPDEHHGVATLIGALAALSHGVRSIYLGTRVPAKDLAQMAETVGARALAIGATAIEPREARKFLTDLRKKAPATILILAGGSATEAMKPGDGVRLMASLEELEVEIAALV